MTDWQQLQLLIQPGQYDGCDCGPNGSPWILTGCWPGHRTGVDIANPSRFVDFPTICYDAIDLDADGRVVFKIDDKLWQLPFGRYSGTVRVSPRTSIPFNFIPPMNRQEERSRVPIPAIYTAGTRDCSPTFPEPTCRVVHHKCCILAQFDIDYGPSCAEHMIDQAVVVNNIASCGDDNG